MVRERLYNLLSALGELPEAQDREPVWRPSFAGAVLAACPPGYLGLRSCLLPGTALVVDPLVVGRAGLLVAVPWASPVRRRPYGSRLAGRGTDDGPMTRAALTRASAGGGHPGAVRDALHRAFALRAWLRGTPWAVVPVLAAICLPSRSGREPTLSPALSLDGLWMGPLDQLGAWLGPADGLGYPGEADLAEFLSTALQVA